MFSSSAPEDSPEFSRIQEGAVKDVNGATDTLDPLLSDLERKSVDLEKLKAEVAGLKQDIKERKRYARRIFRLICVWVLGVFLLLLAQGFGRWWWLQFNLSQPILLAAIGSTTLNVLGLFYIVAHYLFPDRSHKGK